MNKSAREFFFKNKKILFLTLFILLILTLSVTMLFIRYFTAGKAGTAKIYQDGALVREIDLSDIPAPYTFTITSTDGSYNTIKVEQGAIGVTDADCPDKTCRNMGMVRSSAYPISCLPHKLLIQIADNDSGIDAAAQ
ncbi:MAG: NusG domain II-containing protein [Lachnospiraceae bacterium]|nr:NusG domain II-containing protein [Lachnospiraceae bacterium]